MVSMLFQEHMLKCSICNDFFPGYHLLPLHFMVTLKAFPSHFNAPLPSFTAFSPYVYICVFAC